MVWGLEFEYERREYGGDTGDGRDMFITVRGSRVVIGENFGLICVNKCLFSMGKHCAIFCLFVMLNYCDQSISLPFFNLEVSFFLFGMRSFRVTLMCHKGHDYFFILMSDKMHRNANNGPELSPFL